MSHDPGRAAAVREARWLVLVLDPELGYAVLPHDPGTEVVLGGRRFTDLAGEGFNWFGDRLFDLRGRCVGFELSPLIPLLQQVPESIARRPYVTVLEDGVPRPAGRGGGPPGDGVIVQYQIFFGDGPVSPTELHGDQNFLGRVFADGAGTFALGFDSRYFLDPADIDGLSALGIRAVPTGSG